MNTDWMKATLEAVATGKLDVEGALARLGHARPGAEVRVDHARTHRCGMPEVIFCAGKEPAAVARIAAEIVEHGHDLLATRAAPACFEAVHAVVPDAVYHERARVIARRRPDAPPAEGLVAVVTAGTSDVPVGEEARVTAETLGSRVATFYDVGVAGIHRVLACRDELEQASAVVVAAGMEGALAGVVGGLVSRPVIAVPTSIGYGASFGGLAALLGMLNVCVPTVSVVNIDNGFGAATIAHRINVQTVRRAQP